MLLLSDPLSLCTLTTRRTGLTSYKRRQTEKRFLADKLIQLGNIGCKIMSDYSASERLPAYSPGLTTGTLRLQPETAHMVIFIEQLFHRHDARHCGRARFYAHESENLDFIHFFGSTQRRRRDFTSCSCTYDIIHEKESCQISQKSGLPSRRCCRRQWR